MTDNQHPVSCPQCGERQNRFVGAFDLGRIPFDGVTCMVCGHAFNEKEYRRGLNQAVLDWEKLAESRQRASN